MRLTSFLSCTWFLFLSGSARAQTGGDNTYEFLNLPSSPRVASVGGVLLSVKDNDPNLAFQNPSLLNDSMSGHLALNVVRYFAGIKFGYAACAHHIKHLGTFHAGVHFIRYGEFTAADPSGNITGTFKAAENAFVAGWGRPLDSLFSIGVNIKVITSEMESYNSWGLAADAGVHYHNPQRNLLVAAVIKNAGRQIRGYRPDNKEALPFEVQLGLSKKFQHMPLRISLTGRNLEKWDLTYVNPDQALRIDPSTGDTLENKITFGDKLMRHLVVGGELLISRNINFRVGYNYRRRKEMGLDTRVRMTGFSFGMGIRISRFHFSYGRAIYHLAGGSNHFAMTVDVGSFYRKASTGNTSSAD